MPSYYVIHTNGKPSAIVKGWKEAKLLTQGVSNTYTKKFAGIDLASLYVGNCEKLLKEEDICADIEEGRREHVYTDGALRDGVGVYGVYFAPGDSRNAYGVISGDQVKPSVPRAELSGVIEGARAASRGSTIHTDSSYALTACINVNSADWKINADLIAEARRIVKEKALQLEKVAGHSGDPGNDGANALCRSALEENCT